MTTLRRLLVAVYPIRLFLLALAAWSVAADVCAQSPVRVGYYDIGAGAGIPEQVPPIVSAGLTPVLLDNVTATDLAGLHILFVENPSTSGYSAEYRATALGAIKDAVAAGLVLIIHDRSLNGSTVAELGTRFILPLPPGVPFPIVSSASSNDINVSDAATLVASGPAGIVTDTNLDNGLSSNQGSVTVTFIPGRKALLHRGSLALANNNAVTFSYPLGLGFVIYSSIPLDVFLKDMGMATPVVRAAFRNIYAPNVLTYAACGLRALPATVTATSATGHYGGRTTLSATARCGVIPVSGVSIDFSLNGVPVGSATTDASGTATLVNASLGSSPESAIAVGSYPAGVAATFAGTTQYGASSGTALLTVERAPASISFIGGTFVYDAAPHAATGTVTGVFGEPLGVPSFSYTDDHEVTSDAAPRNAGTYRITASVPESANYLGTTAGSGPKIKITPAPLTIRAEDKERLEGLPNPVLTVRYQGFVLDDSEASLDARPKLSTPADAKSPDGTYPILVGGAADQNYTIEHVDGTLTVSPEGRMHGNGVVEAPDARHGFRFEVRETLAWGQKGSLNLEIERKRGADDVFVSDVVADVVFKDNLDVVPGGKAQADTVTITGVGRWNRQLATFEAVATDSGEPGSESDAVVIRIFVGGRLVSTTNGTLKSGNIQSNRIPRRR